MGDLAARNIQRGRDHGSREVELRVLKSVKCFNLCSDYNSYRKKFDLFDLNELGIKSCLNECCRFNYNR